MPGANRRRKSRIDEGGAALAAIQALNVKLAEQQRAMNDKDSELDALRQAVSGLQAAVRNLGGNSQ